MARDRLIDRFVRLCEIPSPTGAEREIADAILGELRSLGVAAEEDVAAAAAGAGAGNVIARIPGSDADRWLLLCAHVDTVPVTGRIEVTESDGVLHTAGQTILGADDKAGVAGLLELVFTVAEEHGLRGAKELDVSALRSEVGLVLDHAAPLEEIVVAAPTYHHLVAAFEGVEAHAGIAPEEGRSAIAAACAAVAAMQLGRLDAGTTANVGRIEGGTAANVVPGRCRVEGEARGIDEGRAAAAIGAMADACTWAASERSCDLDLDLTEFFRGYRIPSASPALRIARAAVARIGLPPREIETGGGSDVNALRARGFDCALLANGARDNHTPAESISIERLEGLLALAEAAVAEAAA